ncbi:MAG: hypothetical protein JO258_02650 [Alphaproteobacteria bacterium]|nr:hypothetical protein [Alphaproteobacteria bacterium]
MDEYEDIKAAAAHRDWQACARLMFLLLFRYSKNEQRDVTTQALYTYVPIWQQKHSDSLQDIPDYLLSRGSIVKRLTFPDLRDDLDLDAADAEFESGLLEFCHGVSSSSHRRYTAAFATAIRSAVTARQINKWMEGHPEAYARWKKGRRFRGPTFLDDDAAAEEACSAWAFVQRLLREQHMPTRSSLSEQVRSTQEAVRLYRNWEETVL